MVLAIRNSRLAFIVLAFVLLTTTLLIINPRIGSFSDTDPASSTSKWGILSHGHGKTTDYNSKENYTGILDENPELTKHMGSSAEGKGKSPAKPPSSPPKEIFEMDERLAGHNIALIDGSSKPDDIQESNTTVKSGDDDDDGKATTSTSSDQKSTLKQHKGKPEASASEEKSGVEEPASNGSSAAIPPAETQNVESTWTFNATRDANNYGLSDEQCTSAFPKLYRDIEQMTARFKDKPITKRDLEEMLLGAKIHAMIYEGELYVMQAPDLRAPYARGMASLHAINRALVGYPDRVSLPNCEFVIDIGDGQNPFDGPAWFYTKRSEKAYESIWLIPDYGFYSWPEPKVGSYNEVRKKIALLEEDLRFEDKEPKLVWRGAPMIPLRQEFLALTDNVAWADTLAINWDDKDSLKYSLMTIPEHCRYQFVAHLDGWSMSGQGKYMHNCESVFVAPASSLKWNEIFSSAIETSGPKQNVVVVKEDWSDLETKMENLLANPAKAKKIAQESTKVFRDRYLTPAAEACYWRKLFQGWRSVSFEPEFFKTDGRTWRGTPFESVALMSKTDWDAH